MNIGIVGVLLMLGVCAVAAAAVVVGLVVMAVRRAGGNRHSEDETGLIQEMHRDLLQMQERIETLEAILSDRQREEADP